MMVHEVRVMEGHTFRFNLQYVLRTTLTSTVMK